ncbi:MAG: hypothetical protein H6881_00535 [Rhodobiaceae bacterium]|nr:hypothetical protein [Hyphomonas sp.]MCB9970035.1 hypothetical protein [Hyphomonas sp.]MCC0050336.1 hypothetical protein [Rhodobiaceae bacterium]
MLKKFLATASVVGLVAGSAHAVKLDNLNGAAGDEPYPIASALDFAGGAVTGSVDVVFGPSAGTFPTGNVVLFVTISGATFDGALDGSEVGGTSTSVISNGGASGASTVQFLISGANGCSVPNGDTTLDAGECSFSIPVELTGADVSVSVGLETDAGADVDNTNDTTRVSRSLVNVEPAFAIAISADTTDTIADLNAVGGPFTAFTGASDSILGTFSVAPNMVDYGSGDQAVNVDLSGTAVSGADVDTIDVLVSGTMDAFEAGDVTFDGNSADDIDAATDEAAYDAAGLFDSGDLDIVVVPDGTTAIARSDYDVSITVTPDALSPLTSGTSKSASIQSIERNGTQITFPWTQSATQGASSGTTSVFRIGNLDNVDAGAVFVEVKNSSVGAFSNPGIVQLGTSIAAGGELVQNSAQIEAAVGNYGRGDLEFTIEADPDTLTARQFVVRNGVIQQVIGGNVNQDINN